MKTLTPEDLKELTKILEGYADDNNYHRATNKEYGSQEVFHEFYGTSEDAKRGLEILNEVSE